MLQFEDKVKQLREEIGDNERFVLVYVDENGDVQAGTDIDDLDTVRNLFKGLYDHFDKARKERFDMSN